MAKNTKFNRRIVRNFAGTIKSNFAILGTVFITLVVLIGFSIASATTLTQTIKVAGSETQFNLKIDYTYVGKCNLNASYKDSKGYNMSLVSKYPSAIVFNITRMPGAQIASCDAEIEVYGIQILADTGTVENHAYFIGTNYDPSFSATELSAFVTHINDLVDRRVYSPARGNFNFNWTINTSILSPSVGSIGCYLSEPSKAGLWSGGKPNSISVAMHRLGYITMTNGEVSVYVEGTNQGPTAAAQLTKYGDAFLQNNLVPASKLPQIDLFHPGS